MLPFIFCLLSARHISLFGSFNMKYQGILLYNGYDLTTHQAGSGITHFALFILLEWN